MLADQVPYIITLVELEEGVRLVSGIPPGMEVELKVGMPLQCKVIQYDDRFALPYFLPLEQVKGGVTTLCLKSATTGTKPNH